MRQFARYFRGWFTTGHPELPARTEKTKFQLPAPSRLKEQHELPSVKLHARRPWPKIRSRLHGSKRRTPRDTLHYCLETSPLRKLSHAPCLLKLSGLYSTRGGMGNQGKGVSHRRQQGISVLEIHQRRPNFSTDRKNLVPHSDGASVGYHVTGSHQPQLRRR